MLDDGPSNGMKVARKLAWQMDMLDNNCGHDISMETHGFLEVMEKYAW